MSVRNEIRTWDLQNMKSECRPLDSDLQFVPRIPYVTRNVKGVVKQKNLVTHFGVRTQHAVSPAQALD